MNLKHARTEEQVKVMTKIQKDGVCPFCTEHFLKYHPKPILHENEFWLVTENMSPYEGSVHHFLFVCKRHFAMPTEMTSQERIALFDLVNLMTEEKGILGGSILIRFGDTRFTGASVDHFHAHLVVGDMNDEGRESLKTKIGYKRPWG
ncbi:MAG TPA: hypothetical protein VJB99_00320 [Patescibacteria group bacterium]|nr:hypothetical protein [Patescibacteria group bacterium]